jgi:predicted metalloprotease with PDZ domain
VEGLTTYYTDDPPAARGADRPPRYLERLGERSPGCARCPAARVQSLAESSFDTWIKFYRPDAHTPNAQVSYYRRARSSGCCSTWRSATRPAASARSTT